MSPETRKAIGNAVEALIAVLADEDREPECEDEGAQCDDEGDDSAWLDFWEFRGDPAFPYRDLKRRT